jgi:hypothetical protein
MKQPIALVLAAITLLGCASSGRTTDPFFGRTTIEPPRTGSVPGQSEPYYQPPNVAGSGTAAPLRPVPGPQPNLSAPTGAPGASAAPNLATPTPTPGPYGGPNTRYITPAANPNPPTSPNYNNSRGTPVDATGWRGATNVPPSTCVPASYARAPTSQCTPVYTCPPGTVPVTAPGVQGSPTLASRGGPMPAGYSYSSPPSDGRTASLANRSQGSPSGSVAPRWGGTTSGSASGAPSLAPAGRDAAQPINITDLPEHSDRSSSVHSPKDGVPIVQGTASPGAADTSQVVQAVANIPSDAERRPEGAQPTHSADSRSARGVGSPQNGPAPEVAAPATPYQANYAHDPEYRSLRGRLEYSQVEQRWKLRYIPSGGGGDSYGGSLAISNPSVLIGYERGDWVEVRGTVGSESAAGTGAAPQYEVVAIQRVGV